MKRLLLLSFLALFSFQTAAAGSDNRSEAIPPLNSPGIRPAATQVANNPYEDLELSLPDLGGEDGDASEDLELELPDEMGEGHQDELPLADPDTGEDVEPYAGPAELKAQLIKMYDDMKATYVRRLQAHNEELAKARQEYEETLRGLPELERRMRTNCYAIRGDRADCSESEIQRILQEERDNAQKNYRSKVKIINENRIQNARMLNEITQQRRALGL